MWYFKIVSNFTRLTAREITYNNFEISLVVFIPNITTNHAITYTNCACLRLFTQFSRKIFLARVLLQFPLSKAVFFFCDLWSMHYWWRKTSKETENAYIFKRRDDDTHSFVLGMSTAVCKFERFSRNEKPLQPLYPIKFHICLRWLDPVFWEGTILLWSSVVSVSLLLS